MIRYFLGIDGGGTKTAFRLEDEKGDSAVKELVLGASNPNDIGMDACLSLLSDGISQVCQGLDLSEISAFAGIAGFASGDNGTKIEKHLENLGFGVVRGGSDVENALALSRLMAGDEVVAVIAGTGSVAYSLHNGKRIMSGMKVWMRSLKPPRYLLRSVPSMTGPCWSIGVLLLPIPSKSQMRV